MALPPVRIGRRLAVPIDIQRVEARMTFEVTSRSAVVEATMEFTLEGRDGCPVLDLRQPVDTVALDGLALPREAFTHHDLGGGEGGEMVVMDKDLPARSRHRLDLTYRLVTPAAPGAVPIGWDDGVRFDFWMSDLHPGRYLEMWLPANLCHDRFALGLDIGVEGGAEHVVMSNGHQQATAPGRWRLDFPAQFTSLSPMLVLAPADDVEVRRRPLALPGRDEPLELVTCRAAEADADLEGCESDVAAWLVHNAQRYGPWAHGDCFTAVVWGPGRGMEYDGATTAAVGALEHEVFHSWFGRGIKPKKASDGWIDEAWTSWATDSARREVGRYAVEELTLEDPPVTLCPPHPWSRYTPTESYRQGARLFAGIAFLLGGASQLREAMARWYRANTGGFVTTAGLEHHLSQEHEGISALFRRYVRGAAGT